MSTIAPPERAVPVLDLWPETEALWDELTAAIQEVMRSGHFILGPQVRALEEEVASYLGVKHAVGLNSATDALVIGLRALGVGPGDEVMTTPFTFFATAEAASMLGAAPVFVDIEPDTLNLDAAKLEAAITERTKAIVPVHVFGQPCDMDAVMEIAERRGVRVLEDCAQCFGAEHRGRKAGAIGAASAWSFFPSKNLGAFGDGGMLTTDDDAVAAEARMLRAHGSRRKYHNEAIGYNSRLDELQAAILRVKLPHIDRANLDRRAVAARYAELFAEVEGVTLPTERPWATHVYHQYTIRIADGKRDAVQRALAEQGIGTMIYYPIPLHRLPVYQHLGVSLPESEAAAAEVLSLPITPTLPEDDQRRVVEAVAEAVRDA